MVPLDIRGSQLSVAFERTGPTGPWVSRSLAPCGFMRLRGPNIGTESLVILAPGVDLWLPEGAAALAHGEALAAWLAGPAVTQPTGVRARPAQLFWDLGLWLAADEPGSGRLSEERASVSSADPGPRGGPPAGLIGTAPMRGPGGQSTLGLADPGGIAIITADRPEPPMTCGPASDGTLPLGTAGFGPRGAALAAELAAHVRAWDRAGQPGLAGLHVDAYPPAGGLGGPRAGPGHVRDRTTRHPVRDLSRLAWAT